MRERRDTEPTPVDNAARVRALEPTRSFIVQAPAGSGKTELLTQRLLRLLATVEHPEQILAITFTRKAAAEMHSRVLRALEAASSPAPQASHRKRTWELARAVIEVDRERGWQLLTNPARLRIQTIDALNASLARRLPVISGSGSALEPSDDSRPLYEAACLQLLKRLGDGSQAAQALEMLVLHLGNRVDRLIELLIEMLSKRDQWLHQIIGARASTQLRHALEGALVAAIERHLSTLCTSLDAATRQEFWELTQYAADNLLRDLRGSPERRRMLDACLAAPGPGPGVECLGAWQAIADIFLRKDRDHSPYQKVSALQGFPRESPAFKARMHMALAQLAGDLELREQIAALRWLPEPRYSDEQWQVLEALLMLLPLAAAELEIVFQARGEADYVEAALRALRALGTPDEPTDLALAFDYRLQHILVDEFQDTSFAQLDLLERLTAGWSPGDGRTLFCVGDPMQSIYRFRQAEVGLFLELQERGLANVTLETLALSANFRSAHALVSWVNRVFPAVLPPQDDAEEGAVSFTPSTPAVRARAGSVHTHASIEADPAAEAGRVVDLVRRALARDSQATIAVLVSARPHVGLIASELARAGIAFQAVEIEQLRARPVVQDLLALTRALTHLADRTAWLAVLRAPWCGMTLAELHTIATRDVKDTIHRLLPVADDALQLSAHAQRTLVVLRAALVERGRCSLRDLVERTWNALGGPATLASEQDLEDAEAYLSRLEGIEQAGDLEDVARLEGQLDRLFAKPRAGGESRVELMTIHKAKGLEFDVVILPSLHKRLRRDDSRLLRWTRVVGAEHGLVLAPLHARGADPDPIYRWLTHLEDERAKRERARVLYVAVTRAKRDLHLLGSAKLRRKADATEIAGPQSGSMLGMLWHELEPAFQAELLDDPPESTFTLPFEPAYPRLRRLPRGWQLPPADAALGLVQRRVSTGPTEALPVFDWVGETARHVGTLVHRELERLVRLGATSATAAVLPHRARILIELAELNILPEHAEEAADRVLVALRRALEDARGRWIFGLNGDIRDAESELAISGILDGALQNIVIDRTFIDRAGRRWIVDFKTSTHAGAGLDVFLAAEVERYRGQLARYARLMQAYDPGRSISTALYFPLLGAWREVQRHVDG